MNADRPNPQRRSPSNQDRSARRAEAYKKKKQLLRLAAERHRLWLDIDRLNSQAYGGRLDHRKGEIETESKARLDIIGDGKFRPLAVTDDLRAAEAKLTGPELAALRGKVTGGPA